MLKLKTAEQRKALASVIEGNSEPMEIATRNLEGQIVVALPKVNRVIYVEPDGRIKG